MSSEEKIPESAVRGVEDKPADAPSSKPKDTRKLKKVFENDGYNKMNEAIGRMLGRLRKEHNMTVKDVKQRLHDDYGVDAAPSTISNWDAGVILETNAKK